MSELPRVSLVHGPTPIVKRRSLDAWIGVDLWIKRDDATGGAEAGNKVRKLEWLLADALAQHADTVVTCGGLQSNHARATALACAGLGLKCILVLRVADPMQALPPTGNVFIDRLAGADVRLVSPAEYGQRHAVMEEVAAEIRDGGRRPYVIPEGGSNGLGSLGYVECMRETAHQMRLGLAGRDAAFDVVVHACGSGGTAAGLALGAARFGVAGSVRAMAVCNDRAYFDAEVARIIREARAWDASLVDPAPFVVDEAGRGPAYGVSTAEQRDVIRRVARSAGLVLDPVYTGKAMHGLHVAVQRGDIAAGSRVLFVHTGGLPGLLAQGVDFVGDPP
ncbi:MAG: D-cysteine desulfhydrase family protein [Polyangiaceae bacterium]|jgi:D-cysteine desulfhydrase